MDSITDEEFLFLAESYRERKKALEQGRADLAAKISSMSDRKSLLWHIYWKYSDVINSKEIATCLSVSVRDLTKMIGSASAQVPCSRCQAIFTLSFSSRSAFEEFKREYRKTKRVRREYLCPECAEKKETERKESAAEWDSHHQQLQERTRLLATMPYRDYLQTPEWQQRRSYKLRRAGYKCELCNSSGRLHVHHRTYENRGNEDLRDLIVLCEPCHQKFHDKLSTSETA